MKRWFGVLIMGMMVGALVYGALMSTPLVLANEVSDNKVYDDFWRILNNETYLVVFFNESLSSGNPNATLARKLIDNSREGELNSANISAQIWLALEELKKSGVKLYYSADELRRMAENISKNGLPEETVNELKAQGWTDEEIKALEEYIAKNADNITGGFDMGSFLTNFSWVFVLAGLKYADYETWALEKWKWSNAGKLESDAMNTYKNAKKQVVPDLANQWSKFYHAYLSGDVNGMSFYLDSLVKGMDSLLLGSRLMTVSGGGIIVRDVAENGIVNNQLALYTKDYYWPNALEAYKQVRRVYVLVKAIKLGNNNPEVREMLNREVAELKDSLVAYVKQSTSPQPSPSPSPLPCLPGKCYVALSTSGETLPSTQSSTSQPTDIALNVNSNYGYVTIDSVNVVVDDVTSTKATYHIEVSFRAEHNVVSDVNVSLTDSSGSDSGHYSMIQPDDGVVVWKSKKFTVNFNGRTKITVSGTVKISYLSTPTQTPTSNPTQPTVLSSSSGPEVQVVTRSYSKTITANTSISPSKVFFEIIPSETRIAEGSSVSFTIRIRNENDEPVSGRWSFHTSYKDSGYKTHPFDKSGSITVQPNKTVTISVGSVMYPISGTYGYSGSFNFGPNQVYSSDDNGEVVVVSGSSTSSPSPTQSAGSLQIVNVNHEPSNPQEGDSVGFRVVVNNSYSSCENITLRLFIDQKYVGFINTSISANSEKSFTLYWTAEAGIHQWKIELWRVDTTGNGVKEDIMSGNINVSNNVNTNNITLIVPPVIYAPVSLGHIDFGLTLINNKNKNMTLTLMISSNLWNTAESFDTSVGMDTVGEYMYSVSIPPHSKKHLTVDIPIHHAAINHTALLINGSVYTLTIQVENGPFNVILVKKIHVIVITSLTYHDVFVAVSESMRAYYEKKLELPYNDEELRKIGILIVFSKGGGAYVNIFKEILMS